MLLPVQPCKVGIPFLGVLKNSVFHSSVHLDKLIAPLPCRLTGIPANPKRDHHWVKRKSTKSMFCQHIFNSMPRFFAHHQIDLAQRDGKKMLMSMITAVSRILCLDFDFPENYTHINQVKFASKVHIACSTLFSNATPRLVQFITAFFIPPPCTIAHEPDEMV